MGDYNWQQWQYYCDGDMTVAQMNDKGRDGWEMVAVIVDQGIRYCYFKRLVNEIPQ